MVDKEERKYSYPIIGVGRLDQDTDPLVMASKTQEDLVDCRNVDLRTGSRALRSGMESAFDGSTSKFVTSGVYFPPKSKATLPLTETDYTGQMYYASGVASPHYKAFIFDFWLKSDTTYPYDRYVFRVKHPINPSPGDSTYAATDYENFYACKLIVDAEKKNKSYIYLEWLNTDNPGASASPTDIVQATFGSATSDYEFPCDNQWHRVTLMMYYDEGNISEYGYKDPGPLEGDVADIGAIQISGTSDWKLVYCLDSDWANRVEVSVSGTQDEVIADNYSLIHGSCSYGWDGLAASYAQLEPSGCYHALWFGEGGNMSISEWRFARATSIGTTAAQAWVDDYGDDQLNSASYPTNLLAYVPFDEGNGKIFTERVESITGFFSPQEPWVNDDNELVFSGDDCAALPSRSSSNKYLIDSRDTLDGEADLNPAFARSPVTLFGHIDSGYTTGWDTWMDGTFQVRIKLMGIKEGCIIGNLWLVRYYADSDDWRLMVKGHCCDPDATPTNRSSDYISTDTAGTVDETWIDTEKTITVSVETDTSGYSHTIRVWVDDTEVTMAAVDWGTGAHDDQAIFYRDATYAVPIYVPGHKDCAASYGPPDQELTKPMVGGSEADKKYSLPFKLLFFRSWNKKLITDDEVSETYDQDDIDTSYKYGIQNFPSWMVSYVFAGDTDMGLTGDHIYSTLEGIDDAVSPFPDDDSGAWAAEEDAGAISLIHTFYTEVDAMDDDDFTWQKDDQNENINLGLLQRPIVALEDTYNSAKIQVSGITDHYELYENTSTTDAQETRGHTIIFNDSTFSQCVSYYNSDTFKLNQQERVYFDYVYTDEYADTADDKGWLNGIFGLYNVIESDSVLQGRRKYSTALEKTRFLLLGTQQGFADVGDVDHMMSMTDSSHQPKWVSGAVYFLEPPAIRGIYHYISEDTNVDKILIVAHNAVYSYSSSAKEITLEDIAIDKNSDEIVNFTTVNNKLVCMDSESAVKLNQLGNWSRLGIDRPSKVVCTPHGGYGDGTWADANDTYHFAYTAQFYDSENDAYSGTIPVYEDNKQGLTFNTDSAGAGTVSDDSPMADVAIDQIFVNVNTNLEPTVDRLLLYRTENLDDTGINSSDLYQIATVGVSKHYADTDSGPYNGLYRVSAAGTTDLTRLKGNVYQDIWHDDKLVNQSFLDTDWLGISMVPPRSKAMHIVNNRLCVGNTDVYKNAMYYSEVDALGFGRPDMVPSTNVLFVSQGSANEITAIYEGLDVGLLFQRESMYRLFEGKPGEFNAKIISGKVGCVNQRCVIRVGNAVYFLGDNGIYRYVSGVPELVTKGLNYFFYNTVSKANIENSFMVYETEKSRLRCYVPVNSTYCDTCVIIDFSNGKFYIEDVPDLVCGYEVYESGTHTVYLGSAWGNVYKLAHETQYYDGDSYKRNSNITVSSNTVTKTGASWSTSRYGHYGQPVFIVEQSGTPTYLTIWKGIISDVNTATSLTVSSWVQLFNCAGDDPGDSGHDGADMTVIIGGVYYYLKTPVLNFPNLFREKRVNRIELFSSLVEDPDSEDSDFGLNFSLNHGQKTNKKMLTISNAKDYGFLDLEREFARFHQVELAGVYIGKIDVNTMLFDITKYQSRHDG